MNKQKAELERLDLMPVADLEFSCSRIFAEMEYVGMKLDVNKWLEQANDRERNADRFEKALNEYILDNPNKYNNFIDRQLNLFESGFKTNITWSSPKKVLDVLLSSGIKVDSVNEKIR